MKDQSEPLLACMKKGFFQAYTDRAVVMRALRIAVIVGTILAAINHGDVFLSGGEIIWWKIILSYFVPYGVSTYSSAAQRVSKG
ncbi:MAG: nitrate/nitrite transporter NrtS [Sphingomonadales bacterium]